MSYGVKIQCGDYLFAFDKEHMGIGLLYTDFNREPLESPKIILSGCYYGEDIKPYLFPLSSMTEEQKKEYRKACELDTEILSKHPMDGSPFPALYNSQDWLNAHHFDYRGLIEKDLAIDATGLSVY
jgi:hexokinase